MKNIQNNASQIKISNPNPRFLSFWLPSFIIQSLNRNAFQTENRFKEDDEKYKYHSDGEVRIKFFLKRRKQICHQEFINILTCLAFFSFLFLFPFKEMRVDAMRCVKDRRWMSSGDFYFLFSGVCLSSDVIFLVTYG